VVRRERGKRGEWHLLVVAIDHVHAIEHGRVTRVDRIEPHDHVVLVQGLVQGGDLPLAVGIVQQVINIGDAHAQTAGGSAINVQLELLAAGLGVGVDTGQLRQ
nr:hypothetical protein [Tanacetum cinerariifolium]